MIEIPLWAAVVGGGLAFLGLLTIAALLLVLSAGGDDSDHHLP